MAETKRLPDAEFELMKIIWRNPSPITTAKMMEKLDVKRKWKPQTVLTMLVRLVEKEFLTSEKIGRERNYTPVVMEEDYMKIETGNFMSRYHGHSVGSLIKTMYDGEEMNEEELSELHAWLEEKRRST